MCIRDRFKPGFILEKEGIYQIIFRSSATSILSTPKIKRLKFTIDKTPPLLDISLLNQVISNTTPLTPAPTTSASGSFAPLNIAVQQSKPQSSGAAKLKIVTQDTLSGVGLIEIQLDGGNWETYSNDTSFKTVSYTHLTLPTKRIV